MSRHAPIRVDSMTPLAWLLGLFLPACGMPGASGLPAPTPMDLTVLARPASPNTALAAPSGYPVQPDVTTPTYSVSSGRLAAALRSLAAAQPRVTLAAAFPERDQYHWVARSAVFNFPDLVTAQITAVGPDASSLVLYSRSVYGYSDLGVNRQRIASWLAQLPGRLYPSQER